MKKYNFSEFFKIIKLCIFAYLLSGIITIIIFFILVTIITTTPVFKDAEKLLMKFEISQFIINHSFMICGGLTLGFIYMIIIKNFNSIKTKRDLYLTIVVLFLIGILTIGSYNYKQGIILICALIYPIYFTFKVFESNIDNSVK